MNYSKTSGPPTHLFGHGSFVNVHVLGRHLSDQLSVDLAVPDIITEVPDES